MKRTLVFLPAWNEHGSIAETLSKLQAEFAHEPVDFLVCDDGSNDGTKRIAAGQGAVVVGLPFRAGLDAAVHTGYLYAVRYGYDFIAYCAADGRHSPEAVRALLAVVWAGECDLAVGSRYLEAFGENERYPGGFTRRLGFFIRSRCSGSRFTDTTSGLRAANLKVIECFSRSVAYDYPELESLQLAVTSDLKVREFSCIAASR